MKRFILLGISVLSFFLSSFAGVDSASVRNHLILAINWSPSPTVNSWEFLTETKNAVEKLSKYEIKDGGGVNKPVLGKGDFWSCLAFRANIDKNNLTHFIQPIKQQGDSLVLKRNAGNSTFINHLRNEWGDWLLDNPYGVNPPQGFSLLTIAKPYCLRYFSLCDKKELVNRTFMIVVSDRSFNGDLYYEIGNLRQHNQYYHKLAGIKDDEVFPVCYSVNQNYFIRHIKTEEIKRSASANPSGYAELYEFVPLQKNFNLNSVFEMPAIVKAKRIKGGKYKCDINIQNRKTGLYKPIKLMLSANEEQMIYAEEDLSECIEVSLYINQDNRPAVIDIRGEVLLNDGIYNMTVMTAHSDALAECGRDGLSMRVPIEYETTAKIFDIIPLWNGLWCFFPDDQGKMVLIWQAILIVLLILLVIVLILIIFYRIQYYRPKIEEISFIVPENLTRNCNEHKKE